MDETCRNNDTYLKFQQRYQALTATIAELCPIDFIQEKVLAGLKIPVTASSRERKNDCTKLSKVGLGVQCIFGDRMQLTFFRCHCPRCVERSHLVK